MDRRLMFSICQEIFVTKGGAAQPSIEQFLMVPEREWNIVANRLPSPASLPNGGVPFPPLLLVRVISPKPGKAKGTGHAMDILAKPVTADIRHDEDAVIRGSVMETLEKRNRASI